MKALTYHKAHKLEDFAIQLEELPQPTFGKSDLLIRVKAFAVNPGDALIRSLRSAKKGQRVILGWEFSGVVEKMGAGVLGFQPGDEVFAAGDVSRDGNYAEYVAVDYRLVSQKPKNQSFGEAAVIPMTFQTAWGALMRNQNHLPESVNTALIIGGAGGVGSVAIQLLKAKTGVTVIATASRLESQKWIKEMGADIVLDHSRDMPSQLRQHNIDKVDMIFSTRYTVKHLSWIVKVLKPYGHLSLIDVHKNLDVSSLMPLSVSIHLETVFSRILNRFQPEQQAFLLKELASMVEAGKIKSTLNKSFSGLTVENIYAAHKLIEQGKTIGKIVIELDQA